MAKKIHSSSGGGYFRVDIDISDFTDEITEEIKDAIQRSLVRIGLKCEQLAKDLCPWKTGRLRNSIENYVEGDTAYIGTRVEYGKYVEEGTSRREATPFLRPAAENNMETWVKIVRDELEKGG